MRQRSGLVGFQPVASAESRALILGSYPSPKSFEEGFYYGHPRNRFWPMMAILLAAGATPRVPGSIAEKKQLILDNHLALWDSLQSCTIIGAQDSSITDAVPNNIPALIATTQIQAVFCNGAASYRYYQQFCYPDTGIRAVRLPSTSPANAACSMQRLLDEWARLTEFLASFPPAPPSAES